MRYYMIDCEDGRRYLTEFSERESFEQYNGPKIALANEEYSEYRAFVFQDLEYQRRWREAENVWYGSKEQNKE